MTAQDILTQWGQYFAQSQFYTDPIVNISWWIIYQLKELVDAANYLLQSIYKMSDFIFTDTVMAFIRSFHTVLWIPFGISVLVLGYTLIFHTTDTRPKVIQNLTIAIMVICALPTIMLSIKDMTFLGVDVVNNYSIEQGESLDNSNVSYAEKIILDNLSDLKYMESQNWDEDLLIRKKNHLSSIDSVDITERLWADQVKSTDDVFDKYLQYDENGDVTVENIDRSNWIWLLSPVYYRYNFNFLSMFLALAASVIALFFTAYKVARLIWELAVHQFLAVMFAASDLTNGQRIKQVLQSIANTFVVIFLTSVLLQFFQLGVQYINNQNINGLVRGFILLFWALACVDAPNIIERILGIDAGISSGFRTFFGFMHATQTAARVAKSGLRTVKSAGGKVKSWISETSKEVNGYSDAANPSGMYDKHDKGNPKGTVNGIYTQDGKTVNRADHTSQTDKKTSPQAKQSSQNKSTADSKKQKSGSINGYQLPIQQKPQTNHNKQSISSTVHNQSKHPISNNNADGKSIYSKPPPSKHTQIITDTKLNADKTKPFEPDKSNLTNTPNNDEKGN